MEQIIIAVAIGSWIGYTIGVLHRSQETARYKRNAQLWERAYDILLEKQKNGTGRTEEDTVAS